MNAQTKIKPHPDAVFGSDAPANYSAIAQTVASMQPRALTAEQLPDVITIIEYMQQQVLDEQTRLNELCAKLNARERELTTRERNVEIRQRALGLVKGRWAKLLGR
jgi:hypothetical protein